MKCLLLSLLLLPFYTTAQKLEAGVNIGMNIPARQYEDPAFYSSLKLNLHFRSLIASAGMDIGGISYTRPFEIYDNVSRTKVTQNLTATVAPYFTPHLSFNYKIKLRRQYFYAGVMTGYAAGRQHSYIIQYDTAIKTNQSFNGLVAGGQLGAAINIAPKLSINIEFATRWFRVYSAWDKEWPVSAGLRYTIL